MITHSIGLRHNGTEVFLDYYIEDIHIYTAHLPMETPLGDVSMLADAMVNQRITLN